MIFEDKLFFIFFVLIGLVVLYQLFKMLQIFSHGSSIRSNPNNNEVKKFIQFIKSLWFVPNHPIACRSLKKTYHTVSKKSSIDFQLREELFEALKAKGVAGLYYPKKSNTSVSKS